MQQEQGGQEVTRSERHEAKKNVSSCTIIDRLEASAGTGVGWLRWGHGGCHIAHSISVLAALAEGVWCHPALQKVWYTTRGSLPTAAVSHVVNAYCNEMRASAPFWPIITKSPIHSMLHVHRYLYVQQRAARPRFQCHGRYQPQRRPTLQRVSSFLPMAESQCSTQPDVFLFFTPCHLSKRMTNFPPPS